MIFFPASLSDAWGDYLALLAGNGVPASAGHARLRCERCEVLQNFTPEDDRVCWFCEQDDRLTPKVA